MRRWIVLVAALGCGPAPEPEVPTPPPHGSVVSYPVARCGGAPLTVHFYDVGQGLAALVELPGGGTILVDGGDSPTRAGCGPTCAIKHEHLKSALLHDVPSKHLSLVWITHQHADHVGGVPDLLASITTSAYADNGTRLDKNEISSARAAATGASFFRVEPSNARCPIDPGPDVRVRAIVPASWPSRCANDGDGAGQNDCSIGLRVDYCKSSVLFIGDAEKDEELLLDTAPATLLQVAHHGSKTSTSEAFLRRVSPRYAVISAGKPGEGENRTYCHPSAEAVSRLDRALGEPRSRTLTVFRGGRCRSSSAEDWAEVPVSDRLFATERDGDVVLTTTGDGLFSRR